ncbi:MAG: hypothetical protein QOF70_1031 [Acetobacteraceae bacterium]|nr:hypothetical protein [Acetobacteraceae bacterium]
MPRDRSGYFVVVNPFSTRRGYTADHNLFRSADIRGLTASSPASLEGIIVFNRWSANILLKSVIAALGVALVILLAAGTWATFGQLRSATQLATATETLGVVFRAYHNTRLDRTITVRMVASYADPIDAAAKAQPMVFRAASGPALAGSIVRLGTVAIDGRDKLVADLTRASQTLDPLLRESWDALDQPKSARRPALAAELGAAELATMDLLEEASARLNATIKLHDPFVDLMLTIKRLVWQIRAAGGDSSILISNSVASGNPLPATAPQTYANLLGRMAADRATIVDAAVDAHLPPRLTQAIDDVGNSFFAADFVDLRARQLALVMAGKPLEVPLNQWTKVAVDHLASLIALAETALDFAAEHANDQRITAERQLAVFLAGLGFALAFTFAGTFTVTRRVIRPLLATRDAMLKVAGGDLQVAVPFTERTDEIGALAGALMQFKQNAVEKAGIEEEQRGQRAKEVVRQNAIDGYIATFEGRMQRAQEGLSGASEQMRATSGDLLATAEQSNRQVEVMASASNDAAMSGQTVAAASEQLSASISEIGRQVRHAAAISTRAVDEANQTDVTVVGLTEAAQRIGAVVQMINAIAGQTNLLALNATIEAARAGDAGKGFAVVASEVKSLAAQTARATEEISTQIAALQRVSHDTAIAIGRIGGTIGEVSSIAAAIAAAVVQQGASTQEISHSTQQAAQRTKDVSDSLTGVTDGVVATRGLAHRVKSAAEGMNEQAEALRSQIGAFLAQIRAA